jgi:hypothetical protein
MRRRSGCFAPDPGLTAPRTHRPDTGTVRAAAPSAPCQLIMGLRYDARGRSATSRLLVVPLHPAATGATWGRAARVERRASHRAARSHLHLTFDWTLSRSSSNVRITARATSWIDLSGNKPQSRAAKSSARKLNCEADGASGSAAAGSGDETRVSPTLPGTPRRAPSSCPGCCRGSRRRDGARSTFRRCCTSPR